MSSCQCRRLRSSTNSFVSRKRLRSVLAIFSRRWCASHADKPVHMFDAPERMHLNVTAPAPMVVLHSNLIWLIAVAPSHSCEDETADCVRSPCNLPTPLATVSFHQSREPHFIEMRLCVRPWNQRRNRYIPVALWRMKQNPGSLSLGNKVQPPSRMRRKTHRIIRNVLTWVVEPFPLERSSSRTENTAPLRRCIQLRREEQGS